MKTKVLIIIAFILIASLVVSTMLFFMPRKYTVTFNTAGGSNIETIKVKEGTKVEELSVPKKEGYVFLYWTSNGKVYGKNETITSNITLEAVWDKIEIPSEEEVKTYTITFNTDGGNSIESQQVEEGKFVTIPQAPTKKGYTFVNWTIDGKEYNFNTPVTSNVTLKAA